MDIENKNEIENEIEDRKYCVYVHTSPSGKKYVGQTGEDNPEKRWGKNGVGYLHKRNDKYCQPAFANAIVKYGWDNFQHEIIADNLTREEADNFEKLLISKLNTTNSKYGYNCMDGGSHGSHSEATRKKISESLKGENAYWYGKHLSESARKKLSDAHKGKTLSEETKRKIGEANSGEKHWNYGKHPSEETIRKFRESRKGKAVSTDNHNARKISQYDKQGNLVKIWGCMKDASRDLEIDYRNIYRCCKGERKTAGGFIWRYYEDELTEEYVNWCNEKEGCGRWGRYGTPIAQYSLSGELICVFSGISEAVLKTGVYRNGIYRCCNGERNKAGGFIWKYYDNIKEAI